jgi:transmembrane sensor
MDRTSVLKDQIAGEAAEWIVRLYDGEPSLELRAEFVEWLLRSPDHVEEFLAVSRVWGETQTVSTTRFVVDELVADALSRHAGNVITLDTVREPQRAKSESGQPRPVAARRHRWAAAAAAATVALATLGWFAGDRWVNPEVIRTAIGEQRSITLADGSIVDINTDSELRVDLEGKERKLLLLRGEARFKVAKDPHRPFVVSTPQARIRALGTIFNVRAESEQTAIAVLEGRVDVRESAPPSEDARSVAHIELKAGQQAAVNPAGEILPDAGPPIERVTEWTNRRLVFREEPLAVVVAEFNRYHRKPIRIAAPELAALRISGTFDSSDTNSLLEYFQRFESVSVEHDQDGIWLSSPSANPQR